MPRLFFITGNENKLKEVKKIIPEIEGLNINLTEIQSLDIQEVIKHKIEEAGKKHKGNIVVEDVSLNLECLNQLPGPFIKWFLKSIGSEGIVKIVKSYNNKKAVVKCVIGLKYDNKIEFFEGLVEGKIVEARGESNFGFDPIFQPDNSDKTYAEMSLEEKNRISHRSLAFEKLKEYLEKISSRD